MAGLSSGGVLNATFNSCRFHKFIANSPACLLNSEMCPQVYNSWPLPLLLVVISYFGSLSPAWYPLLPGVASQCPALSSLSVLCNTLNYCVLLCNTVDNNLKSKTKQGRNQPHVFPSQRGAIFGEPSHWSSSTSIGTLVCAKPPFANLPLICAQGSMDSWELEACNTRRGCWNKDAVFSFHHAVFFLVFAFLFLASSLLIDRLWMTFDFVGFCLQR